MQSRPAPDPGPCYLCDFGNQQMGEAVRDAFAKLGVSTQGEFADLPGPGPVEMVRMIRDPTGAFPRAAVFLSRNGDTRVIVVCTYRGGMVDKQITRAISDEEWQLGEPEALPLALCPAKPSRRRR